MTKISKLSSQNHNRSSRKKYIRFEHELLAAIAKTKPDNESFSAWVKLACWEHITKQSVSSVSEINLPANEMQYVAAVKMIVELNQNGLFNQQIADSLNQQNLRTKNGKNWTRNMVKAVLKNLDDNAAKTTFI
jgi:hypothetical protein